jgi:NAD(P)-dependent dehydrogenase (short-subunit alcohol dehydrogenase family)/acyl dehydratase/putative sterol carrier protein
MALDLDSIGKKIGPLKKEYSWKDVTLYALGVGAGFDDLEYVYEDKLKVVPTFSIGAVFDFLAQAAISSNADLSGILHGEQEIIFHRPIPTEGTLITEGAITHIYDKGPSRGALVVAEADTFHSNGEKLFTNIFTLFCRKDGGFGGEQAPKSEIKIPDREPDFRQPATPSADQPLVYRLSGDIFALHVNPDFARASGFEKPIMHGLCTYGYACRAVVRHLMPGRPEAMTRFGARFSRPIYPGVQIETMIWKTEEGRALFRVVNAETGEIVIDRGLVEWLSEEQSAQREQMSGIRFDGRVAVVTGAGGGLGRAYALELAKRGAKIVVNDLGGTTDGSGAGSRSAADLVVDEIEALGGEAVASYDSVATPEGGRAIVERAVEAFGRLDILINNAGILRDRTLLKMEPGDFDAVLAVHLEGAYNVTRPALGQMKAGGYGRIVMTTSAAGLFGNFGQVNYSAAKLGLVGFMNTLKIEAQKYAVQVNTVAPLAATRLTAGILPPEMNARLKPEYIAPMVVFLCSENCTTSGGIYNAGAGHFSRAALVTGLGAVVGDGDNVPSPEAVAASMPAICSLEKAREYDSTMTFMGAMLEAFQDGGRQAGESQGKEMGVAQVFESMPDAFKAESAAGVDVVFQYVISGKGGGEWNVTVKDGACTVEAGRHPSPTTTIKMTDDDFLDLIGGRLNAMQAYTGGKLKIEGDLMKSQLVEKLFAF